ncbi:MAG: hypothetical protein CME70_04180 [Halobacteriovorax sp.]|nr:hypothetical protein [Halobacteriovorax sp.]|tara:strand:- start:74734 stop:75378 length:645 start_codon:yes stop_codon:yes gene_type:complete
MKTYAHAALAVFFVVLGVKMYGLKVQKTMQSNITESREPILETTSAQVDLSKLQMVDEMNIERKLATLNETGEETLATRLSQLDQLALELEQAFLETGDNFEMIAHLKSKIASIKNDASLGLSNIEEWEMELVYFLIIEEQMTLEEINALSSPGDLNMSEHEWDVILTQSQSSNFKRKIMEYKDLEQSAINKHINGLTNESDQEELIEEIWGEE